MNPPQTRKQEQQARQAAPVSSGKWKWRSQGWERQQLETLRIAWAGSGEPRSCRREYISP